MGKKDKPEDAIMGAIFGEKDEVVTEPENQQTVDCDEESDNSSSQSIEVRRTTEFQDWLRGLKDRTAQQRIAMRLVRVQSGLLGDVKYFNGIGEIRIDYGPGYRVYFVKKSNVIIVLLCGGDKKSQPSDVKRAQDMAKEV
ncbi:type II toxin-antitoxin system RelE/ParE family toxin [Agrobacterium leguminum]|uniref:type II toxin-antitoxin system RelE/ParE family toxin n=1 Tax=Agrobacterium leguminum TaxID=2792015 RepID=UPI003CE54BAC